MRDFLIGFVLGVVVMLGLPLTRDDSAFGWDDVWWLAPAFGAVVGLLFVVRRGARRVGQRADRERRQARGEPEPEPFGSYLRRRPGRGALLVALVVVTLVGFGWFRLVD